MTTKFAHLDFDYQRQPSPAIWSRIPDAQADGGYGGFHFYDEFIRRVADAGGNSGGIIDGGLYYTFSDTGQTIANGTDVVITDPSTLTANTDDARAGYDTDVDWDIGTWVFAGDGTDEDENAILSAPFAIINKLSVKRLAFEARLKIETVANSTGAYFIGLSNKTPANSALTDATGEVDGSSGYLGFQVLAADGDALVPMWKASGATKQTAGSIALTAAKYFKCGFLIDPDSGVMPTKRGKFFFNGVEHSSYLTQANIEASTFPNDVAMGLALYRKMTSTTDVDVTLDWWKLYMAVDRV